MTRKNGAESVAQGARDTKGRFGPGNLGKPAGARHKATQAALALLEGEGDALARKAVEMALGGDVMALRLCLDRLAPPRKDIPVSIKLPKVNGLKDAVEASASVLDAVCEGDITPDEGARILSLLSAHKALIETCDLEARITALEHGR
jgi:hypothetical protein